MFRKTRVRLGLTEEDRRLREECRKKAKAQNREAWNILHEARKVHISIRDARESDTFNAGLDALFERRRGA
jgi:hypothetical protein